MDEKISKIDQGVRRWRAKADIRLGPLYKDVTHQEDARILYGKDAEFDAKLVGIIGKGDLLFDQPSGPSFRVMARLVEPVKPVAQG